jgi:hypothetical protein
VARKAVSTLLVLGVALAIGFRSPADPLGWLGAAGVLAMFVLALSCFAAAVGLLGSLAGRRQRAHAIPGVPALPEQRLRAGRDDAGLGCRPSPRTSP